MAKKLFAALEDATEIEVVEDEKELVSPEEELEVAEMTEEVEEASSEVEENTEALDEGLDAASDLDKVEEVVEKAADEGGLDPVAAEAVRVAIESICARIGANPKTIYSVYAAESFEARSARKANTQIALEGLGEFIKTVWVKIKEFMAKVWEGVKNFFARLFSATESYKAKFGKLKEKVAQVEDAKFNIDVAAYKEKNQARLDKLAQFLGNKEVSAAKAAEMLEAVKENYNTVFNSFFKPALEVVTSSGDKIAEVAKKSEVSEEDKKLISATLDAIKEKLGSLEVEFKYLPYGESSTLMLIMDENGVVEVLSSLSSKANVKAIKADRVVVDKDDIISLCEIAVGLADSVKAKEKDIKDAEGKIKQFMKNMDKIIDRLEDKEENKELAAQIKLVLNAVSKIFNAAVKEASASGKRAVIVLKGVYSLAGVLANAVSFEKKAAGLPANAGGDEK